MHAGSICSTPPTTTSTWCPAVGVRRAVRRSTGCVATTNTKRRRAPDQTARTKVVGQDPVVLPSGRVDARFAPVREAFADVLSGLDGTGSAVAAWHDGAWVVDLWGGWANAARSRP